MVRNLGRELSTMPSLSQALSPRLVPPVHVSGAAQDFPIVAGHQFQYYRVRLLVSFLFRCINH